MKLLNWNTKLKNDPDSKLSIRHLKLDVFYRLCVVTWLCFRSIWWRETLNFYIRGCEFYFERYVHVLTNEAYKTIFWPITLYFRIGSSIRRPWMSVNLKQIECKLENYMQCIYYWGFFCVFLGFFVGFFGGSLILFHNIFTVSCKFHKAFILKDWAR